MPEPTELPLTEKTEAGLPTNRERNHGSRPIRGGRERRSRRCGVRLSEARDCARRARAQNGHHLAEGLAGPPVRRRSVAQSITALSGGRMQVKVFPAGQLVGAMESFDAVASGLAVSTTLQKSRGRARPPPSPIA